MARKKGKNDIPAARLHEHVEHIERLEHRKSLVADEIKAAKAQASSEGFDVKTLNKILKLRKLTQEQRDEQDALLDIYKAAMGMLGDTPLGEAAIRRLSPKKPKPESDDGNDDGKEPDDEQPQQAPDTPPAPVLPEPYASATVEQAREFGTQAQADGKPVTSNPFPARDPRRAAWDESWCAAAGNDGMDIPEAWRKKPKEDDKPDDPDAPGGDNGNNGGEGK